MTSTKRNKCDCGHSICLESLYGDFLYIAVLVIDAMSVLRALVMTVERMKELRQSCPQSSLNHSIGSISQLVGDLKRDAISCFPFGCFVARNQ